MRADRRGHGWGDATVATVKIADVVIKWNRALEADGEKMRTARLVALKRSASYVWRIAKNSIRRSQKTEKHRWYDENGKLHETIRYKPSPLGKPPYEHGRWWKSSFHFEIDEAAGEAYIGPIEGKRHIAPLHEYGGTGIVRWTRYIHGDRVKLQKQHKYEKRPTMQPALEKARPRLAEFWKNVIN